MIVFLENIVIHKINRVIFLGPSRSPVVTQKGIEID